MSQPKAPWGKLSEAEKHECWRRGFLFPKLYDYQLPIYREIWGVILGEVTHYSNYFLLCSRRFGKTSIMSLIALEFAVRYPGSQIRFACPTQKGLKKIIKPIFQTFIKDAPDESMPEWIGSESAFILPNKSEITASGVNKDAIDNLRGQNSHLNLLTEVGFMDRFQYVLKSVLSPQTLTTGGKTIMETTPSDEGMVHESYEIFVECEARRASSKRTIDDIRPLPEGFKEKAIEDSGGKESEHYRREYLCEWITDSERLIIPEFDETKHVGEAEPGEFRIYYHNYTVMDLTGGANDLQAHLYAYYDFERAKIVIEHESELEANKVTTDLIAKDVRQHEAIAFPEGSREPQRFSDNNNLIMLRDLSYFHKLDFSATNKDSLKAMVNNVRLIFQQDRILINPRCARLIGNIKHGIWDKNGKAFERTKVYGHFDLLAALLYLVRNVDEHSNPIPKEAYMTTEKIDLREQQSENTESLKEIFGLN